MREEDISLRMIRLNRPVFYVGAPLPCETTEAASQIGVRDRYNGDPFGMSEMMTVPSAGGRTFLGETFRTYISLGNVSGNNISNLSIQASLKTPRGARKNLLDATQSSIPVFSPGDIQDFVVSQEITEEGTYM